MDKQKSALVEAYVHLGCAQADVLSQPQEATDSTDDSSSVIVPPQVSMKDLDDTFVEIQKWADLTDAKVTTFGTSFKETSVELLLQNRSSGFHDCHESQPVI